MNFNKYTNTSFLFILTILLISSATLIKNKDQVFEGILNGNINDSIEEAFTDNTAFSDEFIEVWSGVNALNDYTDVQLLDDAEYGELIKDEKGNLYFPAPRLDVTKYVEKTNEFVKKLQKKNLKYIYIQFPNKQLDGFTNKNVYQYNYSNQNADDFLFGLQKNQIDYFDLRENIKKYNLDKESFFYKTDHHWTTKAAFWAYQEIVRMVNEKYGMKIDSNHYYTDIDNYNLTTKEECFLGSLGRRVGETISGLDDYTYIEPNFETEYSVYNGCISLSEPMKSGSFNKAIAIEHILNSNDVKVNRHGAYFEWDYRIFKN